MRLRVKKGGEWETRHKYAQRSTEPTSMKATHSIIILNLPNNPIQSNNTPHTTN
ncbi:unnamed protein product [Sphenostylis stenocarpa]|uniref:Uncharacterized protein n=1 Tax=Sphenostylis stenocarpa TaxID=92480 RepID=A0AA86VJJ0_9FABA|nr:unnamed protein product [Sphenostylis stenocarpa]